jgi:iron complex outermembrane receptor protein
MSAGAEMDGVSATAAAEYSKTDGHEPPIDQDHQTLLDEQYGTDASLAPGRALTGSEELGILLNISNEHSQLGFRAYQIELEMGIVMAASLDPFGHIENEGIEMSHKYVNDITHDFGFSSTFSLAQ